MKHRAIDKLIVAGKTAAAVTALLEFIQKITPLLAKATPTLSHWIANGSAIIHGTIQFSLPPKVGRGRRVLEVARYMQQARQYSRLREFSDDVFEAVLADTPIEQRL